MGDPCDKGPIIDSMRKDQQRIVLEQTAQNSKLDRVLENQLLLSTDLKQAIDGLTKIIMADIETRKDVEQLKKDREILFALQREDAAAIAAIQRLADQYKGAGIYENYPKLWNWYQQHEAAELAEDITHTALTNKINALHDWYLGELGWRRFIPAAASIISAVLAIYITISTIIKSDPNPSSRSHAVESDHSNFK